MVAVAFNTALIVQIMRETGVDLVGLQAAGLVNVKLNTDGEAYMVYHVGRDSLSTAEKSFRETENLAAAKLIATHLLQAQKRYILASAEANARASNNMKEGEG